MTPESFPWKNTEGTPSRKESKTQQRKQKQTPAVVYPPQVWHRLTRLLQKARTERSVFRTKHPSPKLLQNDQQCVQKATQIDQTHETHTVALYAVDKTVTTYPTHPTPVPLCPSASSSHPVSSPNVPSSSPKRAMFPFSRCGRTRCSSSRDISLADLKTILLREAHQTKSKGLVGVDTHWELAQSPINYDEARST